MATKDPYPDEEDGDGIHVARSSSKKGELPKTKANNAAIVARIENKLGPVGKGHHNSHRTAAIMKWLAKEESQKGKK